MKKKTLKKSKIKGKPTVKYFFKKKQKISKPFQFPNINRIFNEKFFLGILVSLALVITFIFVSLDLYNDIKIRQKAEGERRKIVSEIQYWQGIVNKYKDYRDAYFQLAILEYRINNLDKAKIYLDKVLLIDPNFEKGRELEKVLSSKY